jgi:CBS domain-containing protein
MWEHRIGALPVVEDGRLVGIVSETDLLRMLSQIGSPLTGQAAAREDRAGGLA